jgi:hypothetical protein
MIRPLIAVVLLTPAVLLAAEAEGPSLTARLEAFHKAMLSDSSADHTHAMEQMLPSEDEIKTIFPREGGRVWKLLMPVLVKATANADNFAKDLKAKQQTQPIKAMHPIDVRTDEVKGEYQAVIAMMAENTPIYRVELVRDGGNLTLSSYVKIKDRWVWIRGLEMIPQILARQDEAQAQQ